jgi:hypothetical protein
VLEELRKTVFDPPAAGDAFLEIPVRFVTGP